MGLSVDVVVFSLVVLSAMFSCAHSGCKTIFARGVSQADRLIIVNKHNEVRTLIAQGKVPGQPRGINLKRMSWDNDIASKAQEIADSCEFKHKSVSDWRYQWVGQNLGLGMSGAYTVGADWNGFVQSWFNEYKSYHYPDNPSDTTGHYTQVVWANTSLVGCGFTYYDDGGSWKYNKLYVCNYAAGGNWINQAPYKTGSSGCENLC